MRQFAIVFAICLSSIAGAAAGQSKDANLTTYLAGVTERGRALYAYDQAAWHATDAFFELKPKIEGLTHYICTRGPAGWTVSFPRWNEAHDKLFVAYVASESETGKYEARGYDQPSDASEELVAKERAMELALTDFGTPNRPYNTAILPASDGNLYVYLYPAQTKDTVWPLGGDVRYTISPDGKSVIEKRQLHKTILDMEFKPGSQTVAGVHSHILTDVPEDTDVLYVLNRKPSIPEYIGTSKRIFIVNTDGTIAITKR